MRNCNAEAKQTNFIIKIANYLPRKPKWLSKVSSTLNFFIKIFKI